MDLKQRVNVLLKKHTKVEIDNPLELFVIKCGYCQVEYSFRLYRGSKCVAESDKPFKGYHGNSQVSHGVCKPCYESVLNNLDMLSESDIMK